MVKDHLGNTFNNTMEMCEHWDVHINVYRTRRCRGWCKRDCLLGKNKYKKIPNIDHEGREFPTASAMCKYWGVSLSKFTGRINRGWSLEDALTKVIDTKVKKESVDHEGNKFDSISDMCRHWNITLQQYYNRIKNGMDLKTALTTPRQGKQNYSVSTLTPRGCEDHLGNEFDSIKSMCEYWGVKYATLYKRLRWGYDLEQALSPDNFCKVRKNLHIKDLNGNEFRNIKELCKFNGIPYNTALNQFKSGMAIEDIIRFHFDKVKRVRDHLGNEYKSEKAMCRAHGVPFDTYRARKYKHYSLEDCLTPGNLLQRGIEDHLGNSFKSVNDMCAYYNISKRTYYLRRKMNWSLDKILTTNSNEDNIICDHLGNRFPTVKKLCEFHNIPYTTYLTRIKRGMSIEDSLSNKGILKLVEDHLGNKYRSTISMCNHYNINVNTYRRRLSKGWEVDKALTTPLSKQCNKCAQTDHLGIKYPTLKEMCDAYSISPSTYSYRHNKLKWSVEKTLTTPSRRRYKIDEI